MRKYVDDFIDTLSTRQQVRVGDILAEARVAKTELSTILQVLQKTQGFTPISLSPADRDTLIDSHDFLTNGGVMAQGLAEIFDVANLISLMIASHAATLTSDIKAQEDELLALEKLADNYAFLLADNNAYDFAYLESFNDESGRDQEIWPLSDRAGSVFQKQNSSVRADEGVLTIPDFSKSHGLNVVLLKGNASAYAIERSSLDQMLTSGSNSGWKTQFVAGGPITSALPEADGITGAQVLLEFSLSQSAPASQIRLRPFAEQRIQLLRLTLYDGDEENGTDVVVPTSPMTLDRPTTIAFPLQTVSRFRVLLNQPVYERRGTVIPPNEAAYALAIQQIVDTKHITTSGNVAVYYFLDSLIRGSFHNEAEAAAALIPSGLWSSLFSSTSFTDADLANFIAYNWDSSTAANARHDVTSGLRDLFGNILKISKSDLFSLTNRNIDQLDNIVRIFHSSVATVAAGPALEILDGGPMSLEGLKNEARVSSSYDYLYNMGLYNAAIGVDAPDYKAVFVSRPLPTQGDPGVVRLKTSEYNYQDQSGIRNSSYLTSVEYSVSSKARPTLESDWNPILPSNSPRVEGERFFVDGSGRGYFRFSATPMASINLHLNGLTLNVSSDNYLYSIGNVKVLGISLPSGMWSSQDLLTVDYTPYDDATVVEFSNFSATAPPLAQAFDNDGVGEGFTATSGRYEITLRNTPYIDMARVADSEYEYLAGMYPYQPVVVKTRSGHNAVNLTNYETGEQGVLPSSDIDDYYFIQNGNVLRFNQPISESLRVYYQYIENNLRFRVVMRVNSTTFVAPKVDYVQLKAKTRKSIDRL